MVTDIAVILSSFLAAILFALKDSSKISSGKSPNHNKGFTLRLVVCLLIIGIGASNAYDIWENLFCVPIILGFTFQYSINLMVGNHLMYIGRTAKFDRLLWKYGQGPFPVFVVWGLLFVIAIGVKLTNYQW
jgi:hypothetical protein